MDDRAPISPSGWQMRIHTYDEKPAKIFKPWKGEHRGRSLDWCRKTKAAWMDGHNGKAEMVIEPVDGWESIQTDFASAIAWAIAQDLVSIEVGAKLIRAIAEEVAGRLPSEGLLGLALYYLRSVVEQGGDDEIESAIEQLSKNLSRRVGDVDAAMPF